MEKYIAWMLRKFMKFNCIIFEAYFVVKCKFTRLSCSPIFRLWKKMRFFGRNFHRCFYSQVATNLILQQLATLWRFRPVSDIVRVKIWRLRILSLFSARCYSGMISTWCSNPRIGFRSEDWLWSLSITPSVFPMYDHLYQGMIGKKRQRIHNTI